MLFGLLVLGFLVIRATKEEPPPPRQWVERPAAEAAAVAVSQESEPAPPDSLTIVTPDNRARLCGNTECPQGSELARISTGTKLVPRDSVVVRSPAVDVTWYVVEYKAKRGYVSIYNTDRPQPKFK